MIRLLFLSVVLIIAEIACQISIKISPRIVNGNDALEGEFPFAVSLRYNTSHICGGTILNKKFVLTAAHCVCGKHGLALAKFNVQYGIVNISKEPVNTMNVVNVICNNFNPAETMVLYDSAVLELENPLPEGTWTPVNLAREFITSNGSQNGTIIGWGKASEKGSIIMTLQKLNVEIYDDKICNKTSNIKHNICFGAPASGACHGDSGGALMVNGVQVGIASYITNDCGIANEATPNIYARVSMYYDWIKNNSVT